MIGLLLAPLKSGLADDEVVIDIIGGIEGATPIAIVPFAYEGGDEGAEVDAEDREGAAADVDIAAIIRSNLGRTGRFDLLTEEQLLAHPARFADVDFATWRAQGIDHLVVGAVRPSEPGRYEVRFELLDVFRGERTQGRRLQVAEQNLRSAAHVISDRIYHEITGRAGVFNSRIAYVAVEELGEGEGRRHRLVVADADGHRGQTILTSREPILSPAWSPERDRLAYVSFEGRRSQIFVQDLGSGTRQRVADFRGINSAPAWSPDGDRLAVTLSRDGAANIYVIELASGEVRALTNHWAIDTEATWAPNGEHLYFTSDRGGRPQIYRINSDGSNLQRVTHEGRYNARPSLSPDGQKLAMVHQHDGQYYIAVKDLETGSVRRVSEGPADESPSFAPNGDLLIHTAGGLEGTQLRTASLLGNASVPLEPTEEPGIRVREPAW
ncbi:Tol-Pal system beta propeller repeat protein TolB [Halorhodospira abdelmalekii]|uniref:Tol-Pal system beta propeller repeat protein TolB n=1 Tax=Halorhodospira abdelmalekii TaxID=421629 RepID=UPI0030844AE6